MDEIGELSLAFNKMTASLKEVTTSKADLEREIAERQQVESRLQAVMDSSPDPIYLKDRDSRLLLANPAMFAVIGKPAEAVLGKTDAEYYHDPVTGRAIIENDWRIIDSGRMEVVEESISDEKSTRVFLSTKAPYYDPDGRVIGLVCVARDITERKRAEEVLAETALKLERSNQELEQFAFVASHDLQEPLRKVKIFGSSLQQKLQGRLDDESQDSFQRMLSATERMQLMIDNLLELARVNTKGRPFVPVDLSKVAAEVISDLEQRILQTGGQVEVEALPCVEADPIQIHQVLQNLIGNGLKFHNADTPPIVKVSGTITKSRIGKGEVVSIQVEDNGIGFEEQQFEKILQPFQRLHSRNKYEGTGMGLAIVKKIVERHHGEISAHSTPGKGSTFIITLPVKVNSS
jgi:PAS domain S-box-containing protein